MTTTTRTVLLTVIPPVLAAAASVALLLVLDLPAKVAVHWGPNGVDRVAGVGELIGPVVGLVPATTVAMLVVYTFARRGASELFGRFVVATSALLGLGISFTALALALAQVGIVDVEQVGIGTALGYTGIALGASVLVSIGLALLAPRIPVTYATSDAPAMSLGENERASWTRSVGPSRTALVVLGIAATIVVIAIVVAGAPLVVALPVLVLFGLIAGLLFWRVTVDDRGVGVRSALGIPRFAVAPGEVVGARAIEVDPMRQFGGFGIRVGALGWGVIVRGGTAVEVERHGKSPFIVTVDDAGTAAALLTAIARRAKA